MSKLVPVEALKEWLEKNWMLGKNSIDRANKIMLLSELEKDNLPTIDLDKIIEELNFPPNWRVDDELANQPISQVWNNALAAVQQAVKKEVKG